MTAVTRADGYPVGGRAVEYFDNSPDFAGATPLPVTAAHTTTADAALTRPGTQPPVFAGAWGNPGHGHFEDSGPMAADQTTGDVYINDGFNRIQRLAEDGTFQTQWGQQGHGHGRFNGLGHLAVDGAGNVYASDNDNRIQKFSPTGAFLTQWGTTGTGNGQFNGIAGIAADSSGNVYVSDSGNDRIQKFSATGTYLTQWGSHGAGAGQFDHLGGVAVDQSSDDVYVLDLGNQRIQKFATSGASLPYPAENFGASGIAADGGYVYVSNGINWVAVYDDTGGLDDAIGYLDSNDFQGPNSLAAGHGSLYVQDTGHRRIWQGGFIGGGGHSGHTFAGSPNGVGELRAPTGAAVDPSSG